MMTREDGHFNGYVWRACAIIHHFHEFIKNRENHELAKKEKSELLHILEHPKSKIFNILEIQNLKFSIF